MVVIVAEQGQPTFRKNAYATLNCRAIGACSFNMEMISALSTNLPTVVLMKPGWRRFAYTQRVSFNGSKFSCSGQAYQPDVASGAFMISGQVLKPNAHVHRYVSADLSNNQIYGWPKVHPVERRRPPEIRCWLQTPYPYALTPPTRVSPQLVGAYEVTSRGGPVKKK